MSSTVHYNLNGFILKPGEVNESYRRMVNSLNPDQEWSDLGVHFFTQPYLSEYIRCGRCPKILNSSCKKGLDKQCRLCQTASEEAI